MSRDLASLRVAVVHDWLTGMRGGEKVLEAILGVLPQADLFTLFHDPGSVSKEIEGRRIVTSSLNRWRNVAGDYRRLLPLFPAAVERWDFSQYDLVVSSSHCAAKGVRLPTSIPHLCYCHTPMRYLWDLFDDYFPRSRPLLRAAANLFAPRLRRWDVATAQRVTRFVANSSFVAERIGRIYQRSAKVIHPFVDEAFLDAPFSSERGEEHVIVSALVPYKRIDLAIAAAQQSGRRLVVIGDGPLRKRLAASAPSVEFLGWVDRETIIRRLGRARSLILPGVEDFGITPLEAMAVGTPVVAYADGGALETVLDGVSGVFFPAMTPEALVQALVAVEDREWDRDALRAQAARFNRRRFESELKSEILEMIGSR